MTFIRRIFLKIKKCSKKIRNLIIMETAVMLLLFSFIMYCQLVIDGNSLKESLKFAFSFIIPLIVFAIPTGISYMLKGMIFTGEYNDPMLKDGKGNVVSPSDKNFVSTRANV